MLQASEASAACSDYAMESPTSATDPDAAFLLDDCEYGDESCGTGRKRQIRGHRCELIAIKWYFDFDMGFLNRFTDVWI